MAKAKYKHYSLMVPDGGKLIAGSNSQDTAGATNYVEKINFRRETDGEVRREGWSSLKTSNGGNDVSSLDTDNAPIRLIHQFEANSKKVLVAAAGDKIYRLGDDNTWVMIAEGLFNLDEINYSSIMTTAADDYKLKAKSWEVVLIDGYIIINNGVDLPLMYREDWACAFPLFSLRERGIVRVGTISEFDGRLFIADVEYFDETIEYNYSYFMQAAIYPYYIPEAFTDYSYYTTTYRVPHIIEFSAWRLADDQREARAAPNLFGQTYKGEVHAMSNGNVMSISLPYALGGTRETGGQGMASFTHNPYYTLSQFELDNLAYDNSTFISGDSLRITITDSLGIAKVYDADVVTINSNWFNSKTWLSIQGAYNNTSTGVLTNTGDEQSDLAHNVVVGSKVEFILLKEPDTFSPDPEMTREASDSIAFPEDGSPILKMKKLGDKLMVHRQTGYLSVSRGDKYTAFYYEERYQGERVADFRNTVINIDSQRQMFMGYNGVYTITPASVEPEPFGAYMMGPEFWRLISSAEAEHIHSSENPLTQEIFTTAPIGYKSTSTSIQLDWGVIAYDLLFGTISQIDYAFTAMTSLFPNDQFRGRSFIMATHHLEEIESNGVISYSPAEKRVDSESSVANPDIPNVFGSQLVRYGYGSSEVDKGPYREFSRNGVDYPCTLKFGKSDLSDKFSEKKMRSYALHMSDIFDYSIYMTSDYVADDYNDVAVVANVKLSTFSTTQQTEVEEVSQELQDLSSEVMIPVFAQGNYFQDVITLTGADQPFKVLGRTFEISGVRTKMTSEVLGDGT